MDLISATNLLSFIVTCTIIELTPGPNMGYLALLSASDGRKAGFAATAGIALGLFSIGIAAALGVAALISNSELAYQLLRWSGIFYLLWLSWDGWTEESKPSLAKTNGPLQNVKFFKRGLIVNLLNPKAAIFYIAILPEFIVPSSSIASQAVVLTITYVMVATAIHSTVVILASTAHKFLDDRRRRLTAQRILSIALAAIAVWFALTT